MSTSGDPVSWRGAVVAVSLLGILLEAAHAEDKANLKTLWKDYQAYGLPAPPAEAKLALLQGRSVSWTNGKRHQDQHLVLLIRPASGKQRALYWAGCDAGPTWHGLDVRPISAKEASIDKTAALPFESDHGRYRTYPDLALAIQCYARGWKSLAEELLNRSRQAPKRNPFRRPPPRPRADRTSLAELAWNHFCNQFAWTKGDRKPIVEKLKKLLAGLHGLDTKAHRNVIADMERTLVAVKTRPESAEAALEGLLDYDDVEGSWLGSGWRGAPHNTAHFNPHYKRLRDLGLAAVPLLLRHRDDFRLTRHIEVTMHGDYTWHLRIADVVAQLLNGLADEPFAYDFLERDGRGVCLDAAHVNAWWKKVGSVKELDYLLKNIEKKPDGGRRELNEPVLQALGARHPGELVKIVEDRLNRQDELLGRFVDALAESKAAGADRERLLLKIARGNDEYARERALSNLVDMKHKEAAPLLIASLEKIPKTPEQAYWLTRTGSLVSVAVWSENEKVWEALVRTARRVDVGQRMQLLKGLGCAKHVKHKMVFLRLFKWLLDDKEIRDRKSSKLFEGPCAAYFFERLAVRDFAAEQFAYILGLPADPEPTWKEADWAKLRQRVRTRLAELEKTQTKEKK
jgi:hypothetical protein